jgi:hypothetical protein
MKPETFFYIQIKKALEDMFGNKVHYQRIESGDTAQGIPDINVCYKGQELWLEAKVDDYALSPLQKSWVKHRQLAGGHVYLINKQGRMIAVSDGEYWNRKCSTIKQALVEIFHDAFGLKHDL